jgi:hypothetical protein
LGKFVVHAIIFSYFSSLRHFLLKSELSSKLSQVRFTTYPSGPGGRLWRRLWAHPGGRPLSRPSAGRLSRCGRPALRAADPAGCQIRAGLPAVVRITTAAAVPVLAPAAWPAVRPLLMTMGWRAQESQTPAGPSSWRAPAARSLR